MIESLALRARSLHYYVQNITRNDKFHGPLLVFLSFRIVLVLDRSDALHMSSGLFLHVLGPFENMFRTC